jgi:nucleotide-binding universal stress UspA family protein
MTMAAFKNILVPTDFSEGSKGALDCARKLADALHASLTILHTVEYPFPVAEYAGSYGFSQEFYDRADADARRGLEAVLTADEQVRYRATLVLRTGLAAQEILAYLREHDDIDLVVMATHGRGGLMHLMMGSVAEKIVRTASCPVVIVRPSEGATSAAGHAA